MYKYFKDENNNVYAYAADGSQDAYIKPGLIPITEEEMLELTAPKVEVPQACTPGQGLVALFVLNGITEEDLLARIASIPDPVARYTAQIAYSRSTLWERSSQTVQTLGQLMSLTESDLDQLFTYAVTVQL